MHPREQTKECPCATAATKFACHFQRDKQTRDARPKDLSSKPFFANAPLTKGVCRPTSDCLSPWVFWRKHQSMSTNINEFLRIVGLFSLLAPHTSSINVTQFVSVRGDTCIGPCIEAPTFGFFWCKVDFHHNHDWAPGDQDFCSPAPNRTVFNQVK